MTFIISLVAGIVGFILLIWNWPPDPSGGGGLGSGAVDSGAAQGAETRTYRQSKDLVILAN